ncbi:MAG: hypothetical protein HYY17_13835 [Planctomycetes bacterium]|nr:hypothetical protein [Planctomycetota bacterium]
MALLPAFLLVAALEDPAEAVRRFRSEYPTAGLDEKILLIHELGKHRVPPVLDVLAPLMTDGPVTARIAAARELGAFDGVPKTWRKLLDAYGHPANAGTPARGVKVTILRSLGELHATDAARFVDSLIGSPDVWIAKAAIDAAGKIRRKGSVDVLVAELRRMGEIDDEEPVASEQPSATVAPSDVRPPMSMGPADILRSDSKPTLKKTSVPLESGRTRRRDPEPPAKVPAERREVLVPAILAALESIAEKGFKTPAEWGRWWRANRRGK